MFNSPSLSTVNNENKEVIYSGAYSDQHGSVPVEFQNNGTDLSVTIRGLLFSGSDFDSLEPISINDHQTINSFTLNHHSLCNCSFTLSIPIPVVLPYSMTAGILEVEINLGAPAKNGGIEHLYLLLTLCFAGRKISSSGKSGHFEDALLEIQRHLPSDTYLKACINCLYSDYSPFGSGLFGTMLCFRNIKEKYLDVASKATFSKTEYLAINGLNERQVQETYLCEQFKQRIAGTGYRG